MVSDSAHCGSSESTSATGDLNFEVAGPDPLAAAGRRGIRPQPGPDASGSAFKAAAAQPTVTPLLQVRAEWSPWTRTTRPARRPRRGRRSSTPFGVRRTLHLLATLVRSKLIRSACARRRLGLGLSEASDGDGVLVVIGTCSVTSAPGQSSATFTRLAGVQRLWQRS